MFLTAKQADAITSSVWLIGIGILITTGYWWPGILFLIGAGSIAQSFVEGRGWYSIQAGFWTIGVGIWALFNWNLLVLFLLIALSTLMGAFVKPSPFDKKPQVDPALHDDYLG